MRRTLVILCFLAGLATAPLCAQGIDPAQEQYVNAFLNSRKAEELEAAGDLKGSLRMLRAVADTLTQLKQSSPAFQPEMRDWRLKRTMEAIDRLQGKMGPEASAPEPGNELVPPLGDPPSLEPLPADSGKPAGKPGGVKGANKVKPAVPAAADNDPVGAVQRRITSLEAQLSEANEKLEAAQQKNEELSHNLTQAMTARNKAEADRKKAQDLAELYQKNVLELKNKGDNNGERAKELETQLALAKKQNIDREADLRAAEERIDQLLARSRAIAGKAAEAGNLPKEVKTLQSKLEAEQKSKAELNTQLAGITKERDDAREEITRLKSLNKKAEQLMTDNAGLLKKLQEAEKQIFAFKADIPKKDEEITSLRTQVTDAQKALAASQQKNTTLQAELTTVQKKVDEYTKQIQQFKTDKTASLEEKRRMEEENRLLQGIVMRVLEEDANRASRRILVQKEMDRLQIQSDVLLKQINYLTQPTVSLTKQERRLFKKPVLNVDDPNMLVVIKSDNPPTPPAPAVPATPDKQPDATAPAPGTTTLEKPEPSGSGELPPLPTDPPAAPDKQPEPTKNPKTSTPGDMAKLNTPTKPELPTREPGVDAGSPTVRTAPSNGDVNRMLSAEVKPIADQAKAAFEREKYPEAEKLYDKALQIVPNNLHLLSNKAVVQFRMGKLKQSEETFRKALANAPEDAFCWGTLGIVQYSQNKYDEAVNSLTKSLAINPKNPTAHNYLGITAAQKGWLEAAEKELLTAVQLDPKYADAWFNLAVTHTLKQPPAKEDARKCYQKAVALGAEADPAMDNLLK
jgi:tetratricopeptide (TPR) repeat protein